MRTTHAGVRPMIHPLHAILLAFPLALFTGALVSDIAYLRSAELQWSNFSAWLITGAMVMATLVLAWALVGAALARGRRSRALIYLLLVALMWGAGLLNAFQHSRDGWSSVGAVGLALSSVSMLAALLAAWLGFSSTVQQGDTR